ncbi:MAG: hypothetical protein ACXAEX_13830 [Promethearchaeota archaeon]|jgi:hypothetical protein
MGSLFFSKVNKNRLRMANNIFEIAGFISAILIYSQDLIGGANGGFRLEDINLCNHHFYVSTKQNVIFAYFVEKHRVIDNFKTNIQKVIEKFIDKYYITHIPNLKEISPPLMSLKTLSINILKYELDY